MHTDPSILTQNPDWNSLAQNIADGEAVLILGPEAIPYYPAKSAESDVETSFSTLSRQRVINKLGNQISQYYHRDNLFQFKSALAKQKAMKCIREASRDTTWIPDQELIRQIVAMPFPLILSINPDRHLFDAFSKLWQTPQFDYFTTKDKPHDTSISYPDGDRNPILYHLCGSVEDKLDSVILDYYDLFELLKNILADNGVPEPVTRKLQEADRFILLGFELDRWYFQLFLHYLNKLDANPFNNFNQNFPILSEVSEDSRAFIMRQFNIEYFGTSRTDFEQLFEACERQGILRDLSDNRSDVDLQIRTLLSNGKMEDVFALLESQIQDSEQQKELALLQIRYATWQREKEAGITDSRDQSTEINRIRYTLLTYCHEWLKEAP